MFANPVLRYYYMVLFVVFFPEYSNQLVQIFFLQIIKHLQILEILIFLLSFIDLVHKYVVTYCLLTIFGVVHINLSRTQRQNAQQLNHRIISIRLFKIVLIDLIVQTNLINMFGILFLVFVQFRYIFLFELVVLDIIFMVEFHHHFASLLDHTIIK